MHWLDAFLPTSIRTAATDQHRRARLLITALLMVVGVALPTATLLNAMDLHPEANAVLLGVVPTLLILPLLWLTRSIAIAAHVLTLLIFIQITGSVGSSNSFAIPTLLSVPILSTAVAGRWHGLPWSAAVAIWCSLWAYRSSDMDPNLFGLTSTTAIMAVAIGITMWIIESSRLFADLEARRASADANAERERLQRLRSVAQLAARAAHDYNNLLTVVGGYATTLPGGQTRDGILKAVSQATDLTRELLTFSSMNARPDSRLAAAIDLRAALLDSVDALRAVLPANGQLIIEPEQTPTSDSFRSHISAGQLQQILLNLVSNAVAACDDDALIYIYLEQRELTATQANSAGLAAGIYQTIRVQDNGHGMPKSVLTHAFDPFFTTKPPAEGSGLGLASCYGIAQALGGTLLLSSEEGVGTEASLLLPNAAEPAAGSMPLSADRDPEPGPPLLLRRVDSAPPRAAGLR